VYNRKLIVFTEFPKIAKDEKLTMLGGRLFPMTIPDFYTIIIIFIYHTRIECKIQKLNSAKQKYGRLPEKQPAPLTTNTVSLAQASQFPLNNDSTKAPTSDSAIAFSHSITTYRLH